MILPGPHIPMLLYHTYDRSRFSYTFFRSGLIPSFVNT